MIKRFQTITSYVFATLFILMPQQLLAETEMLSQSTISPVTTTTSSAFSLMSMLNMAMGLVVVIALILGLAWVLKKYGRLPNQNMVDMKVLGGLSLGTREKAILIEVENTRLLVGVAPGHIQTLHVLGTDEPTPQSTNESFDATLNKIEKENAQA